MGGRKRTWEAVSFEVVMTVIALIALIIFGPRKLPELVLAGGSGQIRIVARHFLQAKHVEIGHVAADTDNALRVHAAVAATAGLNVPGYYIHAGYKLLFLRVLLNITKPGQHHLAQTW